jgi:hypothetical protein
VNFRLPGVVKILYSPLHNQNNIQFYFKHDESEFVVFMKLVVYLRVLKQQQIKIRDEAEAANPVVEDLDD